MGTEHKGLRASEGRASGLSGQLLVSHQMRTVGQPMRGLNSISEKWSQLLALEEMVAEILELEHEGTKRLQGIASN